MLDCVIIGGGIIGLSIAEEVSRHGGSVLVLDRRRSRRTASWAAAGILPPPIHRAKHDAMEQLRALSDQLYPNWCERIGTESGVAVEFNRCGGVYLGRKPGETAALSAAADQWHADGVRLEHLAPESVARLEPALSLAESVRCAYLLPDEALVRPPRLIGALRACLESRDVRITHDVEVSGYRHLDNGGYDVLTSLGPIDAANVCIAAGPWSHACLRSLGLELAVEPRRGQMLMWQFERPLTRHVVNEGPRYLLSRDDGCLLAGSTVEDVGFDDKTTAAGRNELLEFACSLIPALNDVAPVAHWAGLRPASRDGFPLLGRIPRFENLFVATGHFRSGIHLAPATARLIGQLIRNFSPDLDLTPFAPTRA